MRTQRSFNRFVLFWLNLLPLLFLAATFEHCYVILKDYSDTLTLAGINVSTVSKMLLVIAIDASIYFSLAFIPQARARRVETGVARTILAASSLVSVTLNVKYMVDHRPDGAFSLLTAVVVGVLIPSMLALFGWLEGQVLEQNEKARQREGVKAKHPDGKKNGRVSVPIDARNNGNSENRTSGEASKKRPAVPADTNGSLRKAVRALHQSEPGLSRRQIAARLGCSHTLVNKYLRET